MENDYEERGFAFNQYEQEGRLVTELLNSRGEIILLSKRRDMDYSAAREAVAQDYEASRKRFLWQLATGQIYIYVTRA